MDKVPRRYNKVNKEEKISKKSMKSKERCGKSKFEQLLLDIKQSKNLPRTGQNPGKITSGRITVKSGIFSHAERSEVIFRNDKPQITEESQAILNEDLMKIIDLAKSQKSSKKCERNFKSINDSVDGLVLNQFSNNLCIKDNSPVIQSQDLSDIVDCVSDEKSLFKDINKKYEQLMKDHPKYESNENYLDLEDNDLEKFVESRMEQSEHIDIWESHSKEVLDRKRIKDFKQLIIKNIVKEQKHIVQDCISNDIVANFNETPVSNTIKRKFIKRFNEMTLVNNGYQSEAHCSSTEVEGLKPIPQGCSTPIKDAIFPETSYHTPPNQKHVYKVPDSEVYQTVLYVAPDDHQNNLKQKVSQKENFVEVIVPPSVSSQTGLYEIATKDPKDFIFSPKIENLKTRNPFGCLENSDKNVLSKWKNKLKHVYDCGPKKDNIQLGENTVINLRKNLLFEDCDNVLSRPKKICKRNRSSDVTLKNIQSSPFSKFMNENDSNCSTRSEIRRKLNYSNDLSFDGEHFDAIETSENIRHFPTSLFTEVGEPSKTNFKFIKPKSNFEIGENFNKHKIDNDCKYCTKNNGNAEKTYKSNFAPSSPLFNELGEPVLMPKSPKYEYKNSKQFFTEMGESSKSKTSERVFEASKHYSPIKNRHSRLIESRKSSPKKLEPFKLNIKGLSSPNTTENIDWKPFEDFNKLENIRFKSLVVDPSSPNCHTNSKMAAVRSRSPFTVSSTNYSPGDKRKCCPHCLQSPKRNKLQVVPLSPSEYMLRKKVLPHTITSDMKPKNIPDSPVFRLF